MRSRHSTRTCYQISLRFRFDATETRACGRERRRYHVKGLIAWPKASSLVGLFPECIVTRTVSIKACARRRRSDRVTVREFISWLSCTLPLLARPGTGSAPVAGGCRSIYNHAALSALEEPNGT